MLSTESILTHVPYTVTTQCIVPFSHVTLHRPSLLASQYVEAALTRPAPFFCITMTVIAYLYGRFNDCNPLSASEMILFDQSFILALLFWCLVLRKRNLIWQCVVSSQNGFDCNNIVLERNNKWRWRTRTACTDCQWELNRLPTLLQSLYLQC